MMGFLRVALVAIPATICRSTSSAAICAAMPVAYVVRLPPVISVNAIESVSGTIGCTSSIAIPSVSASCIAIDVRVPPMSIDPSRSVTVPSAFTIACALDGPPPFIQ